jgi:transposase
MKKYRITLTESERTELEAKLAKGKAAARKLSHARIMLQADSGPAGPAWTDEQISAALHVDPKTVANVRQRFVEQGFEVALNGLSTRNHRLSKVDGEVEAHLIALLCGPAPTGYSRWTLRLVADQLVQLKVLDQLSHETVRKVMQANTLKPWLKDEWCLPPDHNGEFVYHMEDILAVYRRPLDPKRPLVCLDELPYQLIAEARQPLVAQPGRKARYDYEYRRAGVCNLFMVFAPLLGRRYVRMTDRRTYQDWAYLIRDLVDQEFRDAERLVVVMDNLNIHVGGALYETFPPAEAERLLAKLEIHYTPKHGSWLNMAEIELSVLSRQCLDRRLGSQSLLKREVQAWEAARNTHATTVDWRFTTAEARIKLKRLYPVTVETPAPAAVEPTGTECPAPRTARPQDTPKKVVKGSRIKTRRRLFHNRIV